MASTSTSNFVTFSIKIPKDLKDRLEAEADRRVVGRDLLAQKALEAFLDKLPPIDGKKSDLDDVLRPILNFADALFPRK